MIVLTPRIIRGSEELAEVSERQKNIFSDSLQKNEPFNIGKELQLGKELQQKP